MDRLGVNAINKTINIGIRMQSRPAVLGPINVCGYLSHCSAQLNSPDLIFVFAFAAVPVPHGRRRPSELIDFSLQSHNLIVFRLKTVFQRLYLARVRLLQWHNYASEPWHLVHKERNLKLAETYVGRWLRDGPYRITQRELCIMWFGGRVLSESYQCWSRPFVGS